jgi:hypothetical protein
MTQDMRIWRTAVVFAVLVALVVPSLAKAWVPVRRQHHPSIAQPLTRRIYSLPPIAQRRVGELSPFSGRRHLRLWNPQPWCDPLLGASLGRLATPSAVRLSAARPCR